MSHDKQSKSLKFEVYVSDLTAKYHQLCEQRDSIIEEQANYQKLSQVTT